MPWARRVAAGGSLGRTVPPSHLQPFVGWPEALREEYPLLDAEWLVLRTQLGLVPFRLR